MPQRVKNPLTQPLAVLEMCSFDFMSDVIANQRKTRTLNLDAFNEEATAIVHIVCLQLKGNRSLINTGSQNVSELVMYRNL